MVLEYLIWPLDGCAHCRLRKRVVLHKEGVQLEVSLGGELLFVPRICNFFY